MKKFTAVGKRLSFCRQKLGLTRKHVSGAIGLAIDTITNRERGYVASDYGEFLIYSDYYNKLWQKQFSQKGYPRFKQETVYEITPEWILYGVNRSALVQKVCVSVLQEMLSEQQKASDKREIELICEKSIIEQKLIQRENERAS